MYGNTWVQVRVNHFFSDDIVMQLGLNEVSVLSSLLLIIVILK